MCEMTARNLRSSRKAGPGPGPGPGSGSGSGPGSGSGCLFFPNFFVSIFDAILL